MLSDFTTLFQQFLQSQQQLNQYFAASTQQQQERHVTTDHLQPVSLMSTGTENDTSRELAVQLPIFNDKDGENVLTWLLQVDLLFKARKVEDEERLQSAERRSIAIVFKSGANACHQNSI
ncbi:hypothetical protein C2G38_2042542 [Gigaspora rosea]|uniref:Uncharacterized protein n=1 Tax=Gigaspora rosea TaxID=44941 RepID=A0A397UMY9_9GLOM|nr:hypothetical protein C2G38_2042542 [Gigaspora rosea]